MKSKKEFLSTLRIFAFNLFFYRLEAINPIHYLFLLASKITRRLQKFGKRQNYIKQLLAIDLIAKTEIIALMSSSMQNNLHEIWRRVRERSGMFYYNFAIGLTSITKTEFHSLSRFLEFTEFKRFSELFFEEINHLEFQS